MGQAYYQTIVTGTPGTITAAYTYSPNANYHGSDSFTFTASDGTLLDTATVSITVTAVSDGPPVASNATVTTNEDTDYSGTLVATDEYGDTLTYRVLTSPSNGTATVTDSSSGTYTYSPTANYNGSDSLTFTASDGTLLDTATVSITVTAVNDAPVASSGTATTNEDTDYSGTVSASDVDNNALTYSVLASPSNGTVSLTGSSSRIITQDPASINDYLFQQAAQNRIEARGWPVSENSEGNQENSIYDSEFTVLPQYSTFGSRTNTEETIGSWTTGSYAGANRTRGNIFLVSAVDTVVELRFYMSIDTSTSLYYMVYRSTTEQGTYDLVDSNYVASSGTGEGWYSSGAMNAPLEVGKYYFFGTSWSDSVTYGHGNPSCTALSFGTHTGVARGNLNGLYEPVSYTHLTLPTILLV